LQDVQESHGTSLADPKRMKRILAIYRDQTRARRAVDALERLGIPSDDISVLSADSPSGQAFMASARSDAKKGAVAGVALGSTGGLVAGAALGAGAIFTGPIGAILAGSVAGGLLGGLVGLGIPENEAEIRAVEIADGAILVGADVEDESRVGDVIRALGGSEAHHVIEPEESR